ncbi:MAG: LIC_13355 family lipoprotein [Leptospiraceae bacterium]|nr:LIC_13355 family lipoprotein [Leptospiraceae bacterium]
MNKSILSLIILLTSFGCNSDKQSINSQGFVSILLVSQNPKSFNNVLSFTIPTDTADTITLAPNHTGIGFQDSAKAINGIRGAGTSAGSGDVFSLRATGAGASMVLEWNGNRVLNGSGIDFIVFENVFYYNNNSSARFMEAVIVEVSQDNSSYCGFSPNYTFSPETTYSNNPSYWSRFAGITPSIYNVENRIFSGNDLYDTNKTGGDGFDLEDLSAANDYNIGCDSTLRDKIKSEGFVYLRLTAASARTNSDTGTNFLQDIGAFGGGPDIDGVIARYRSAR